MSVVALSNIDHDQVSYHKGDTISVISDEQAKALVDAGVALPVGEAPAAPEAPTAAPAAPEAPAPEAPAAPAPAPAKVAANVDKA